LKWIKKAAAEGLRMGRGGGGYEGICFKDMKIWNPDDQHTC
jgi:hypothetical protein